MLILGNFTTGNVTGAKPGIEKPKHANVIVLYIFTNHGTYSFVLDRPDIDS